MVFRRGLTLFSVLVSLVILLIASGMLLWAFRSIGGVWTHIFDINNGYANHRRAYEILYDHLRNAQMCTNATNGVLNSVVSTESGSSITYYSDPSSCSTVTYSLSGTDLVRTVGGNSTVVAQNVTQMTLTYYTTTAYNGTWTSLPASYPISGANVVNLAGVKIDLTTTTGSQQVSSSFYLRFRNSPKPSG